MMRFLMSLLVALGCCLPMSAGAAKTTGEALECWLRNDRRLEPGVDQMELIPGEPAYLMVSMPASMGGVPLPYGTPGFVLELSSKEIEVVGLTGAPSSKTNSFMGIWTLRVTGDESVFARVEAIEEAGALVSFQKDGKQFDAIDPRSKSVLKEREQKQRYSEELVRRYNDRYRGEGARPSRGELLRRIQEIRDELDLGTESHPSALGTVGSSVEVDFGSVASVRLDPAATVSIFDAAGRLVARDLEAEQREGCWMTIWDGRDRSGDSVPSGVYFARLPRDGSEGLSRRIVLVK